MLPMLYIKQICQLKTLKLLLKEVNMVELKVLSLRLESVLLHFQWRELGKNGMEEVLGLGHEPQGLKALERDLQSLIGKEIAFEMAASRTGSLHFDTNHKIES